MELWIAPSGDDAASGRAPQHNGTDGPLASPEGARRVLRAYKDAGALHGPVTVWVSGGRYELEQPLRFGPDDSLPVTWRAVAGETPIFSGGRRITDWKTEQVNGREAWVAELPAVARGEWSFRSLWADGVRCPRARLPKEGFFRIADLPQWPRDAPLNPFARLPGNDELVWGEGDLQAWPGLGEADVVAYTLWLDHRLPVASVDAENRTLHLARRSVRPLVDDKRDGFARYFVENLFEALSEPGEWFLDAKSGRLFYLPLPGQTPQNTEIIAPHLEQLLLVGGEAGRPVEWLRFEGIEWAHTDWDYLDAKFGGTAQAAWKAKGALHLEYARGVSFADCTVRHVGGYAVEIGHGCFGCHLVGCELEDLGAGGVQLSGGDAHAPTHERTGAIRLTDNHIHAYGRVFAAGVGILARHAGDCRIAHNHIHDGFYTAISVGWVWGYKPGVAHNNLIEANHIHDIGRGLLSDMGGVYLLGVAPGTRVRGNWIYGIEKYKYGGWAIYPDEGSSHLLIEGNVCTDANETLFNQHFGRENLVRNNIFVAGGEGVISLGRGEAHRSFTLQRNILVARNTPFLRSSSAFDVLRAREAFDSDLNLWWLEGGEEMVVAKVPTADGPERALGWEEWRAMGQDGHSLVADPRFVDFQGRDLRLLPDSPAWEIGFEPIDLSRVGPRPRPERAEVERISRSKWK